MLFAGSEQHAASGVCEVELVIDNSDGRVGIARNELSVMRRLDRAGDSDYLLNRQAVRRLDVRDLLAEAGLGRDLHCIIAQGTVDQVLLAQPDERRGLVEEAAGLGKFKRRRQRAEAKLARVAADLERAGDVERELRARLRPLELQATAAERAEALGRQIAEARLRLLASALAETRRTRSERESELVAARKRARRRVGAAGRDHRAPRGGRGGAGGASWASRSGRPRTASRWRRPAERLTSRREALAQRLGDITAEAARERELAGRLAAEAASLALQAETAIEAAERLSAAEASLAPVDEAELATARRAGGRERRGGAGGAPGTAAELTGAAAHAEAALAAQRARAAQGAERRVDLARAAERARAELATAEAALAEAAPAATRARSAHEAALAAEGERSLRGRRIAVEARDAQQARRRGRVRCSRCGRSRRGARGGRRARRRHRTVAGRARAPRRDAGARARRARGRLRARCRRCARALRGAGLCRRSRERTRAARGRRGRGRRAARGTAGVRPQAPAPAGAVPLDGARAALRARAGGAAHGVWLVKDAPRCCTSRSGIAVTREGLGYDADRGVAFRSGASGRPRCCAHAASSRAHTPPRERCRRERAARGRGGGGRRRARGGRAIRGGARRGAGAARSELAAAERAEREAVAAREAPLVQPSEPSTIAKRPSGSASS